MREFGGLGMQQFCRLGQNDRALGIGLVAPGFETFLGRRDLGLKFRVGQALKLLQDLAGGGIGALVFGGLNVLDVHVFVLLEIARTETAERRSRALKPR